MSNNCDPESEEGEITDDVSCASNRLLPKSDSKRQFVSFALGANERRKSLFNDTLPPLFPSSTERRETLTFPKSEEMDPIMHPVVAPKKMSCMISKRKRKQIRKRLREMELRKQSIEQSRLKQKLKVELQLNRQISTKGNRKDDNCGSKIPAPCVFYIKDRCNRRSSCLYMHEDYPCLSFYSNGYCSDVKCKFFHGSLSQYTAQIVNYLKLQENDKSTVSDPESHSKFKATAELRPAPLDDNRKNIPKAITKDLNRKITDNTATVNKDKITLEATNRNITGNSHKNLSLKCVNKEKFFENTSKDPKAVLKGFEKNSGVNYENTYKYAEVTSDYMNKKNTSENVSNQIILTAKDQNRINAEYTSKFSLEGKNQNVPVENVHKNPNVIADMNQQNIAESSANHGVTLNYSNEEINNSSKSFAVTSEYTSQRKLTQDFNENYTVPEIFQDVMNEINDGGGAYGHSTVSSKDKNEKIPEDVKQKKGTDNSHTISTLIAENLNQQKISLDISKNYVEHISMSAKDVFGETNVKSSSITSSKVTWEDFGKRKVAENSLKHLIFGNTRKNPTIISEDASQQKIPLDSLVNKSVLSKDVNEKKGTENIPKKTNEVIKYKNADNSHKSSEVTRENVNKKRISDNSSKNRKINLPVPKKPAQSKEQINSSKSAKLSNSNQSSKGTGTTIKSVKDKSNYAKISNIINSRGLFNMCSTKSSKNPTTNYFPEQQTVIVNNYYICPPNYFSEMERLKSSINTSGAPVPSFENFNFDYVGFDYPKKGETLSQNNDFSSEAQKNYFCGSFSENKGGSQTFYTDSTVISEKFTSPAKRVVFRTNSESFNSARGDDGSKMVSEKSSLSPTGGPNRSLNSKSFHRINLRSKKQKCDEWQIVRSPKKDDLESTNGSVRFDGYERIRRSNYQKP